MEPISVYEGAAYLFPSLNPYKFIINTKDI